MSWLRPSLRRVSPLFKPHNPQLRPRIQPRLNSTFAPPPPPHPKSTFAKVRPYLYATTFFALGGYTGAQITISLARFPSPEPNSPEDRELVSALADALHALPLDEAEVDVPVLYETGNTLVTASMAGIRGLGVQTARWDEQAERLTMCVWFGDALSGWPGITHGGAIGTVFLEAMKKAIQCKTGSDQYLDDPATLSLTYVKPTTEGSIYFLVVEFAEGQEQTAPLTDLSPDKDFTKKHHNQEQGITRKLNKKYEVDAYLLNLGALEEPSPGRPNAVCVSAKGTWNII